MAPNRQGSSVARFIDGLGQEQRPDRRSGCHHDCEATADQHRLTRSGRLLLQQRSPAPHRRRGLGWLVPSAAADRRFRQADAKHSGSVRERVRIVRNFRRRTTTESSPRIAGELTMMNEPARACSISACGGPCQRRPETSTLVSRTARTPPTSGADGLHFRIDHSHRHRCDACPGDTIRDRQQRISRTPTLDGIAQQPLKRSRRQQSRFARCLGGGVGQLDLDLRHRMASIADITGHVRACTHGPI